MTYNGRLENVPASLELVPCKHLPWWRRTEDVFSVTFFCLPRRLEDITARRLANTSLRRLEDVLEDVLKTSWKCLEDVLKTSWKTFQEDVLQIRLEDVLKTRNVWWVIISNHALKVMIETSFLKNRSKLFQQSQINCLLWWVKSSKILSQNFEILCSILCYYFSRTL